MHRPKALVTHLYFLLREGTACSAVSISDLDPLTVDLSSTVSLCLLGAGRISLLKRSFSFPMFVKRQSREYAGLQAEDQLGVVCQNSQVCCLGSSCTCFPLSIVEGKHSG